MSLRERIKNKRLIQLNDKEVMELHLYGLHPYEILDFVMQSTLHETEMTMRLSRGSAYQRRYAPLLCGFAILDQIGGCYSDLSKTPPTGQKGIRHALHFFGKYSYESSESQYLYALRNGLVHDASFVDCDKKGVWRVFRLNWELPEEIVLPKKPWNGDYNQITFEKITWINPRKFTDSISDMLINIKKILENTPCKLNMLMSKEEMLSKYFDVIPIDHVVRRPIMP